jgi:hypothetical protein
MAGFPVANVLLYVTVAVVPVVVFWALLNLPRHIGRLARRVRRPPAPVSGPPIERLAADLRRVHRALAQFGPGTPVVRRRATRQAYDALLVQACDAVHVEHRLAEVPEGIEREIERLRVEEALRTAGLAIP